MELHSFNRVIAVAQSHDEPVIGLGSDGQNIGYRGSLHDQRMVPGGLDGIGEPGENPFTGVPDDRGLAVHDLRGPDHPAAEYLPEALQAQTYTQNRS